MAVRSSKPWKSSLEFKHETGRLQGRTCMFAQAPPTFLLMPVFHLITGCSLTTVCAWRGVSEPPSSTKSKCCMIPDQSPCHAYAQMGTFFVVQGSYMDRTVALPGGRSFVIPAASLA